MYISDVKLYFLKISWIFENRCLDLFRDVHIIIVLLEE